MIVIGFNFTTNGIYICGIGGKKTTPSIKYKNKIALPNYGVAELTEWFETELTLILKREKPNVVTYRLTINNITNVYVSKVYYGQAILNLLCAKENIHIEHTSPSSITYGKFNLTKGADLQEYVDMLFQSPNSPWDGKMKDTALMALIHLK